MRSPQDNERSIAFNRQSSIYIYFLFELQYEPYLRKPLQSFGRADQLGSIEVGKRADLVVPARNLFEVDRDDIHNTHPAVVIDGVLVHGSLSRNPQQVQN